MPYATTPDPCPAGFPPTVTSSPYDPMLRGMIIAHKERQAYGLTAPLGDRLAIERAGAARRPMDSGPTRTSSWFRCRPPGTPYASAGSTRPPRWPGGRPASCAQTAPVTVRIALAQTRGVRDQAGLDARTRRANLAGGFRLRRRLPAGQPVVVVDDLVTTGSSLTEAASVLRRVGCRTARRGHGRRHGAATENSVRIAGQP